MNKPLCLSLICLASGGLMADSIILSDGTVIEGKIVNADSRMVTIDVQFSPTIREEKSYARAEVVKINRSTPDDVAFEEISSISPPSTADDVTAYDPLIGKVRSFIEDHSYSRHIPEARKLAGFLESERGRIVGGETKVDGQWVGGAAAGPDKSELGGRIQLSKMKSAPDAVSALVAFDVLEKQHATCSAYPEAVKIARESIGKLRAELLRARTDLDRRTREQEQGLKLASADRRLQMEQGIAQEKAAAQAQIDRAKQSGSKWLPLLPDAKVLDEMSKLADSEDLRLAKIDTDSLNAGVAAAAEAKQQIESGQLVEAKGSLEQAGKLWPQYVLLASLNESLKKAEKEAADKAKEEAKP